MTAVTAAIRSERAAGQVILAATTPAVAGANVHTIALPAGFGDCLVIEAFLFVDAEATSLAAGAGIGSRCVLQDPASSTVTDFVDSPPVQKTAPTGHSAHFRPDQLVIWRTADVMGMATDAIDTNAAPTAVYTWLIRVRRLRDEPRRIDPREVYVPSTL